MFGKRTRRSRKLNNQFRHVYMNMMAGNRGKSNGPWVPLYNRLVKDLLLDLQDSSAFPSNGYLHEQMHQLQGQARRITEASRKTQGSEVSWDSVLSAVKDGDLFWESKIDQVRGLLVTKCFALVNDSALNQAEIAAILSALGGTHLSDHGVVHVNCVSVTRLKPLSESREQLYERALKRLMLDLVVDEMHSCGGESELSRDERRLKEKLYDWYLMKRL